MNQNTGTQNTTGTTGTAGVFGTSGVTATTGVSGTSNTSNLGSNSGVTNVSVQQITSQLQTLQQQLRQSQAGGQSNQNYVTAANSLQDAYNILSKLS